MAKARKVNSRRSGPGSIASDLIEDDAMVLTASYFDKRLERAFANASNKRRHLLVTKHY